MTGSRLTPALTLLVLVATACSDGTGPSRQPPALLTDLPRPLTQAEAGIAQAANQFSFDLLRAAQAADPNATIFLSPLSASMALGMTLNGASGETHDQMRSVLGFGALSEAEINAAYKGLIDLLAGLDNTSEILVANSIWAREGVPFVPAFIDAGQTWFNAEVQSVDFDDPASLVLVNDWVKSKTGGKIPKLLDSFDPDVVMALLNAIFFKGAWREPFDPKQTAPGIFRGVTGDQSVPMMNQTGPLRFASHQDYQAAELLYGNGAFAMTLVLPSEGRSVRDLAASLNAVAWSGLTASLTELGNAHLMLPKLKLEYTRELSEDLLGLGMLDAFSEARADFSRLVVPPPRLMISSVLQKTFLEVNEEGTTAAAATAVQIIPTSAPPSIGVDRPFLLVLRERLSGTILFIGQISNIPPAA
jgi:serpin B